MSDTAPRTLDRILPSYDQHEVHSRWIRADPAAVWGAMQQTTAADIPLSRLLMWVRSAGRERLQGPLPKLRPALQMLAQTEGHELVQGLITKAWRPTPKTMRLAGGPEAFTAFDEPGWVKVVIDIRLSPERGGTRMSTETRCLATDRRTRVAFGAYWLVIRAGSGLIRRETLAAVGRLAERPA